MHLQCLPIKMYRRAGYVDDPLQNIVYVGIWLPAWILYASSSTIVEIRKFSSLKILRL